MVTKKTIFSLHFSFNRLYGMSARIEINGKIGEIDTSLDVLIYWTKFSNFYKFFI